MKYIIFDTETTCLNNENVEIWQFSGQVIDFDTKNITKFNYNFRTNNPLSYAARVRCFTTQEEIDKYPEFDHEIIIKELMLDSSDVYYVGHNVKFDREVIISVLKRIKVDPNKVINLFNDNLWIDTYKLAKRQYNDLIVNDVSGENPCSFALEYLFHLLHLYKEDEVLDFHDAQFDVEITLRLLKHLCKQDRINVSITNGKELARLSNLPVPVAFFQFGKYKGQSIREVFAKDKSYIKWLLNSDMCNPESSGYNEDLLYTLDELINE